MSELLDALIEGGDYTPTEAREVVRDMKARVQEGESPEEVLYDEGLEPDYIYDIL
jgi:polyhydroxyalkanoate synthesis regulator phasin